MKKKDMEQPAGRIEPADITSELRDCYIDYSMSVIIGRALPDVRDGLKPVHRRILYAMDGLGLKPSGQFRKSVRIVGDVLGKYHPHGDSSVYDAMVRMAQDFSCRYPTVTGHGNFGSVDGDKAAAMRYTEAKMSEMAVEMLRDIDMDTVDFVDNFDGSETEPSVLPSRLPYVLVNGSQGIAVGMATSMPPHNLAEAVDALITYIDHPDTPAEKYREVMPAPDFPTGGIINGTEGVLDAYKTGRGRIRLRARSEIAKGKRGKASVIFTEIPYMVNKSATVAKLAEMVRDGKIEGISAVRDESDLKNGIRVVIEVKAGYDPEHIREYICQVSDFETTYGQINLALVPDKNGKLSPKILSLPEILACYTDHQRQVVLRRTQFEKKKAEARLHLLSGLIRALENIDQVVALIRSSKTPAQARKRLIEEIEVDEEQARSILDMRLARLTSMEISSVRNEIKSLEEQIKRLLRIILSPRELDNQIKRELRSLKKKYTDPRRTEVLEEPVSPIKVQAPSRPVEVAVSMGGYVTVPGRRQEPLPEGDALLASLKTDTASQLVLISASGQAFTVPVAELESGRGKWVHAANIVRLPAGDSIAGVFATADFSEEILLGTSSGMVKRVSLGQFDTRKRDGVRAIGLKDGARVIGACPGECDDALFFTAGGYGLRFDPSEVAPTGRNAAGVKGIALKDAEDEAVFFGAAGKYAATMDSAGAVKTVKTSAYKKQNRGGRGLQCISPKAAPLAAAAVSADTGAVFRTPEGIRVFKELPVQTRTGKGEIQA